MLILVGLYICVFLEVGAEARTSTTARYFRALPTTAQIEENPEKCEDFTSQILRLETHLDEKINGLRRDIWSSSRNLDQLVSNTKSAVDGYRNEIRLQRDDPNNNQLQPNSQINSDSERRELQVAIASLRLLVSDVADIRKTMSDVVNTTNSIKSYLQLNSNIQQIFKPSSTKTVPSSCLDIKLNDPTSPSSVHLIQPIGSQKPFMVYCDMEYQDGGWTTIHNRFSGEQDFYLDWKDYKVGFGNIAGEHWLGLEKIYEITGSQIHELLIQLVDMNNMKTFASYSHFSLGSEDEGFSLKVLGGYAGTAGDSLSYHAGSRFSTRDRDQDSWSEGTCARSHGGAWWYKSCDKSNLNGRYLPGNQPDLLQYQTMYWETFGGPQIGLKFARMMIRPKQNVMLHNMNDDDTNKQIRSIFGNP